MRRRMLLGLQICRLIWRTAQLICIKNRAFAFVASRLSAELDNWERATCCGLTIERIHESVSNRGGGGSAHCCSLCQHNLVTVHQ